MNKTNIEWTDSTWHLHSFLGCIGFVAAGLAILAAPGNTAPHYDPLPKKRSNGEAMKNIAVWLALNAISWTLLIIAGREIYEVCR